MTLEQRLGDELKDLRVRFEQQRLRARQELAIADALEQQYFTLVNMLEAHERQKQVSSK